MTGRMLATLVFSTVACRGQLPLPIFQDVPATATYYNPVNMLRVRLITNGCQASPQMFCPDYWPNGYTPYFLTRGQAATLIVRSLFSGLSGDPENFWAPEAPYFTDVQWNHPPHPQFRYIQKLKELGITSGCTATEFCPEREISYGEFSVFVYRAMEKKRMQNEYAHVPPPQACSYDLFADVLSSHPFCAYIREVYSAVGSNAISPECPSGYFCPDVAFNEYQQWVGGVRVKRETASFYLVSGILDADNPHMLPTSNGQLLPVSSAGPPVDCEWSGPAMVNMVLVAGSQLYGYSYTTMSNYSDADFWSFVVAPTLKENSVVRYSTSLTSAGTTGAAQVNTPMIPLYPANDYEHPVVHQITTACPGGGTPAVNSVPYPTLFSVNQPVLYRGMYQQVSFRGMTLEGANAATARSAYLSPGTSSAMIVPAAVSNWSKFGATLGFVTPAAAATGQQVLSLLAEYAPPQGVAGPAAANGVPVYVADPTPVLTSLSRYSGTQGDSFLMYLNGMYFGANPRVCLNGVCTNGAGTSTPSPVNGVTLLQGGCTSCTTDNAQMTVTISIASNATVGSYSLSVISQGAAGNGWAPGPQGGSPQTGPQAFQVQAAVLPTVRLQSVLFDPVGTGSPGGPRHFVNSFRASGNDYTSEANTSAPLTNLVYDDPSLSGSPSLAPAVFRLVDNQSTPLSRRPKLSFVILRTVGSTSAFSTTLRIESSNPKLQFPDAPISFANGEGRVVGLTALADFSTIDNYTTTLTFRLLSNPQVVIASFTLPVYIVYDLPRIFTEFYPAPGLVYPSASQTVTDKRIELATTLAAGTSSAAGAADPIITNVRDRFGTGGGSIANYSYSAWILYNNGNSTVKIDCISFALVAGAILNMAGIHTNVGFSFPTIDADALSQDTRFIGAQQQYLRMYEEDGLDANDFEGYLETVIDNKAYTVWPKLLDIETLQAQIINGTSVANQRAFSVMYRMTGPTQRWEQWWTTGEMSAFAVYVSQAAFPYP